MASNRTLFDQKSDGGSTLVVALLLCLALMLVDVNTSWLVTLRNAVDSQLSPVHQTAELPHRVARWLGRSVEEVETMRQRLQALERDNLRMSAQLLQTASLRSENRRLRQLLGSKEKIADRVLIAELLGVVPNPGRHEILLDRGAGSDVFVGQPVLDAAGLVGQVVQVSADHCRVLLLTDELHGIPVEVNRNGVRAVASGIGEDQLQLRHVPESSDLVVGDLLVSSGLGDRFPAGYPVATVVSVHREPESPYAQVRAQPTAALLRSQEFLLVFPEDAEPQDQAVASSD